MTHPAADAAPAAAPAQTEGGSAHAWHLAVMVLGAAVLGSSAPVTKLVAPNFPVFAAGLYRVGITAACFLPLLAFGGRWRRIRNLGWDVWRQVLVMGLAAGFGFTVFLYLGMAQVSGVLGSLVLAGRPAVVAVGAWLFLHERLGRWRVLAVAVIVVGIASLALTQQPSAQGPYPSNTWLGVAMLVASMVCEAVYVLMGKRLLARVDPLTLSGLIVWVALPVFALASLPQWLPFDPAAVPNSVVYAMLWWGPVVSLLGSTLWYLGLQHAPGVVASALMGLGPVVALLLSYWLLGEAFEWPHVLGYALVLLGIGGMAWAERRAATG